MSAVASATSKTIKVIGVKAPVSVDDLDAQIQKLLGNLFEVNSLTVSLGSGNPRYTLNHLIEEPAENGFKYKAECIASVSPYGLSLYSRYDNGFEFISVSVDKMDEHFKYVALDGGAIQILKREYFVLLDTETQLVTKPDTFSISGNQALLSFRLDECSNNPHNPQSTISRYVSSNLEDLRQYGRYALLWLNAR